jgi:predicted metal-dependent peptidase
VLLGQFFGEIQSIVGEVKPEKLHVVYCDDQIQGHNEFDPGEDVTMNPKGFGGTDFRPVFDYLEKEGITPACLIYLTDMLGTFPAHAPDYPVLWGDTEGLVEAPFGETVRIRPE